MLNHVANKFSLNLQDILHIEKETSFDLSTLAHIKSHNYNQNRDEEKTKILPLFLFFSIVVSPAFVWLIYDIDNVFCKFFVALLVYQTCAKNNRDKLQKEHSNTLC